MDTIKLALAIFQAWVKAYFGGLYTETKDFVLNVWDRLRNLADHGWTLCKTIFGMGQNTLAIPYHALEWAWGCVKHTVLTIFAPILKK